MNNLDILAETFAEVFSAAAPFAFAAGLVAMMFSAILRFYDYCARAGAREMHDLKKEVEKCKKTVDDLERKYPPISPCDFHSNCENCKLYNTGFCWKYIKERENI